MGGELRINQPAINSLPFVNTSFFLVMMKFFSIDDLITIYTAMLFEQSVLIIADESKDLLKIAFSLHSLLYPFEVTTFIPYLIAEDDANDDYDTLETVNQPVTYLMGILAKDCDRALNYLSEDVGKDLPLVVSLTQRDLNPESKKYWVKSKDSIFLQNI